MDTDFELTRVSDTERKDSEGFDDYFYSSDYTRLIKCPPCPEFEDDGVFCTYDFTQVQVICDNACDIDTCGLFSDGLVQVELPEGITHLGSHAFKGRDLSWVELPKSLKFIGKDPFALTSTFNLFSKNDNFTKDKNGNLYDIANKRLIHNIKSKGTVEIPSDILSIDEYAFSRKEGEPHVKSYYKYNPGSIEKDTLAVVIPSSVDSIGDYAFENCNVRTVTFMGNPKMIGTNIFKGCFLLEKICVPFGFKDFFLQVFADHSEIIDDGWHEK